jgi:predicted O-methyltransferase YrrM
MEFPPDSELPGWLSDVEAAHLRAAAYGHDVLEIGTWKGRSAVLMAQVARRVVCVDHFTGDKYTGRGWFLPECIANLEKFNVRGKVVLMVGAYADVLPLLHIGRFGMVYYDADHDYEPTRAALAQIVAQARPYTRIAVHDYSDAYPQVKRAVADTCADLLAAGYETRGSLLITKT